jgi:tetratricopeptide (TPR) repeat protein
VETSPSTAPIRSPIARLNPTLEAIAVEIRQKQLASARTKLEQYLAEHPSDAAATFLLGLSYHREQKYGQALSLYGDALKADPEYAVVLHFKGWALYYLGQLDESRTAFDQFLAKYPDDYDSHFALGLIALDEDDVDLAREQFNSSLQLLAAMGAQADRKAISKAHTRLSEVYERQDKLDEAARELTMAVELYPDHYEAAYKLSRILMKQGRTEEAKVAYDRYIIARERVRPGTSFPE